MKTTVRILIKYSTSKCNKDLLDHLHRNIEDIKKRFDLAVVIVYDELIPKLGNSIKKLPILIVNNHSIVGNEEIKKFLTVKHNKTVKKAVKRDDNDDLNDFWNDEMHSNLDNDIEENDVMEKVKHIALEQTVKYKDDSRKKKEKKREPEDNIKTENISSDKISDMVNEDPIMKKFWENQESTPGFD